MFVRWKSRGLERASRGVGRCKGGFEVSLFEWKKYGSFTERLLDVRIAMGVLCGDDCLGGKKEG